MLGILIGTCPVCVAARSPAAGPAPVTAAQGEAFLVGYDQRPDVQAFIDSMVAQYGFVPEELRAVFAHARYNETVAALMGPGPAARPVPWSEYRARFVEPARIDAGVRFWQTHSEDLERAERTYGVPAQIIVAILDIETLFGRNTGNFRVLDALTTLAFDYPNKDRDRSPFFREQLEDFLVMARDDSVDVLALRGSYAGAIGMPQFMPGSIRRFAVDFDGDGTIDLKNSAGDAIGSVANFLASQGWRRGGALVYPATLAAGGHDNSLLEALQDAGSEPHLPPEELRAAGLVLPEGVPSGEPLSLVTLPDGDNPTIYLAGTQNFYVITRYNRSFAYAMAVIELGRAIRGRREAVTSRVLPATPDSAPAPPPAPAPLPQPEPVPAGEPSGPEGPAMQPTQTTRPASPGSAQALP